jgi:hypothetical protein
MPDTKYLVDLFNNIRANATDEYKNTVPFMNYGDSISTIANPILNYEAVKSQFLTGVTNMIGLTIFKEWEEFRNPLAILKQRNLDLGVDVREIAVDILDENSYSLTDEGLADVLKLDAPVAKECIHRLNRQVYFKISISDAELELAFNSWSDFDNFFVRKAEMLYMSNEIAEFKWAKELLRQTVQKGYVPTIAVSEVTNETTGKEFVVAVKDCVADFMFPSKDYNMLKAMTKGAQTINTWVKPENTVLVAPQKLYNKIDVNVLASAFNLDKADFLAGNKLAVDDLGYIRINTANSGSPVYKYYKLQGMIFDKHFTQIYDKKITMKNNYIASALVDQRYLHIWQTYSTSPFADVVAFVTEVNQSDIPLDYVFEVDIEKTVEGTDIQG